MARNIATDTAAVTAATHLLVLEDGQVARLPAEEFGIDMVAGLADELADKAATADVAAVAAAAAAAAQPARISSSQIATPTGTDIVGLAPADVAAIAIANGMTPEERGKLADIEAGAQANPARISSSQIATPTGTDVVGLAPADAVTLVQEYALGAVDGGSILDAGTDPLPVDGGSILDAS